MEANTANSGGCQCGAVTGNMERSVSELAEAYDLTLAAVSKHLKVLEAAHLIERRKDKGFQMIKLNAEALKSASEWLRFYKQFWTLRLNELERILIRKRPNDQP